MDKYKNLVIDQTRLPVPFKRVLVGHPFKRCDTLDICLKIGCGVAAVIGEDRVDTIDDRVPCIPVRLTIHASEGYD